MVSILEVIKDFGEGCINNSGKVLWGKIIGLNLFSDDLLEKYKDEIPWVKFISYQPMDSERLKKYESYLDWRLVFCYQSLSSEDILRNYEKVGLQKAVLCQHFTSDIIYEIEKKNPGLVNDRAWNRSLLYNQILSEDFILDNLNRFSSSDILLTQRITPKIRRKLIYDINFMEKYIRASNHLYRTDIGKDWFIGYAKNFGSKFNPRFYIYNSKSEILTGNYGLLKVRVFYNDYISKWEYSKADIIKEIGAVYSLVKRI